RCRDGLDWRGSRCRTRPGRRSRRAGRRRRGRRGSPHGRLASGAARHGKHHDHQRPPRRDWQHLDSIVVRLSRWKRTQRRSVTEPGHHRVPGNHGLAQTDDDHRFATIQHPREPDRAEWRKAMLGLARRFMALGAASLLALTLVGGASAAAPAKYTAILVDDGGCSFHMEASWKGGKEVVRVVSYIYIDRSPVGAGAPDLVGFAPDSPGSTLTKTSA